jgi:hypothetical protein
VRLVTLWFTPDPNPAPPVVRPVQPVAAPAEPKPVLETKPVPKVEPRPAPEAKSAPKVELSPAPEAKPAPKAQPKPAPVAKPAPEPRTAAAAVPAAIPAAAAVPVPKAQAVQVPKPAPALRLPLVAAGERTPAAPSGPLKSGPSPASCPQPNPALLKTCVALDYKNAQLTAQIGQLEDKVKVLQLAMGRAPAAVVAAPRAHPAAPAGRLVPYVASPRKPATPPEPAFPWLWLAAGGAVLLGGAGAAALVVRRRRAEQERKARALKATLPPVMGSVKNRLKPGADAGVEAGAELAQE